MLEANTPAPNFTLINSEGKPITLSDYKGLKNVVLVFYPFDWSAVCGDQIALYNQMLPLFAKRNAEIIGISMDSMFCHQAFIDDRHIKFNLLSDFEPKGKIAKLYDVYETNGGYAQRALFVLDKNQLIQWSYVSPTEINPGADGIFAALDKINP